MILELLAGKYVWDWATGSEPRTYGYRRVTNVLSETEIEEEAEDYRCSLDGNALCVVTDDFVDLQESDAVFITLTKKQIKEIKRLGG